MAAVLMGLGAIRRSGAAAWPGKKKGLDFHPSPLGINMTIDDALHYSEEDRAKIVASYPAHERDARVKGIPILGSGRIFPAVEESITFDAFDFPHHWPAICGLNFGWGHPTAAAWARHDRDADIVRFARCEREVPYRFTTPGQVVDDFWADVARL